MLGKHDRSSGGKAATLLATCFVVIGGALVCSFMGIALGENPFRLAGMTGGCFGGIVLLLWLLREKEPGNTAATRFSWLARAEEREKFDYRPAPRVPRHKRSPAPNAPPTAETVRALTGGLETWVPSRDGKARATKSQPPQTSDG